MRAVRFLVAHLASQRARGVEAHAPAPRDVQPSRGNERHVGGLASPFIADLENVQEKCPRPRVRVTHLDAPGAEWRPLSTFGQMIVLRRGFQRMAPGFLPGPARLTISALAGRSVRKNMRDRPRDNTLWSPSASAS